MVMVLEEFEKREQEFEEAKELLRKKAADLIDRLTSKRLDKEGKPRYTINAIAARTGLSRVTVGKIRSRADDIGVDTLKKVIEAFEEEE